MDLLDSGPAPRSPRRARASSAWVVLLLALVPVVPDVRQGGLDLLEPATPLPRLRNVSLVLDAAPSVVGRGAEQPWNGVLVLELEPGAALLQVSAAARAAAVGPAVDHAWGSLRATLDDVSCTGTFGWRGATGDPYGTGRIDVECDDGRSLTAALRTYDRPPVQDAVWHGLLDLARADL